MDRAGLACPGNATGGLGARLRALQASGGDRRVCGTPGKLRGAGRLWPRDDGDDGDVTTGRVLDQLLSSRWPWPTSMRTCWFVPEMGGDTRVLLVKHGAEKERTRTHRPCVRTFRRLELAS